MGPDGVVLFLITRLLEGTGMGIMAITGAVAITPWFPKEKRGFPMGIWSMWVSLAAVICPLLYAHLVGSMSVPLDAVWFGTAAFDVIVLVIFLLLYRNPEHPFDDAEVSDTFGAQGTKHKFTDVFKSKAMIGMALIFLFDEFAFIGINQFLSPYLQSEAVGLDLGAASIFVTMFAVTGAAFSFIGGKLSDVFKTRRWLMLFGLICGGVFCVIVFNVTEAWLFWPLSILAGIVGAMAPTRIYAATPEAVPGDLVPEANSLIAMTQNLGMLAGSLVMGVAASAIGFAGTGIFIMMPMFIICIVIFFATTKSLR
jgi:MFS family permease